ncbi:MAG: hypothetical protein K0A90_08015 [Methanosarcinaceae archaeon]|nr:hypothetical protein [Methanosarcinaceae archaeon]
MQRAIDKTDRRRTMQIQYNKDTDIRQTHKHTTPAFP